MVLDKKLLESLTDGIRHHLLQEMNAQTHVHAGKYPRTRSLFFVLMIPPGLA